MAPPRGFRQLSRVLRYQPEREERLADAARNHRSVRAVRAAILVTVILTVGTFGYYELSQHSYSLLDCLYMTSLTVSTVGFSEVIPMDTDALKVFTILLIFLGAGSIVYFLTALASIIVEGDLQYRLWRIRMERRARQLTDHIIVCGAGRNGRSVIRELVGFGARVAFIEVNQRRADAVIDEMGNDALYIEGDALSDGALITAGIGTAAGLVATLKDDRDNLFLCINARQLNPNVRIIAKSDDTDSDKKYATVGASSVVSPAAIGARRIAAELVRPELTHAADLFKHHADQGLELREVVIGDHSPVVGKTLGNTEIQSHCGCVIIALKTAGDERFIYHPRLTTMLRADDTLMAAGHPDQLAALRIWMSGDAISHPIHVTIE